MKAKEIRETANLFATWLDDSLEHPWLKLDDYELNRVKTDTGKLLADYILANVQEDGESK